MQNRYGYLTLVAMRVAASYLILFAAASAPAQTRSNSYGLLVASGFLCDPSQSGNCLAVAKSTNGDSYEISGAGTFNLENKSIKAAGTFNYRATNGILLETGVWIASDLLSFGSYGTAPITLLPKGPAFATAHAGPRRFPIRSGPAPTGGLAILRILLIPLSGTDKTALLEVNCALGDVPRERSMEGIRITLEKSKFEYSEESGGRVMFLALEAQSNVSAKPPAQPRATDTPEQQR